MNNLTTNGLDKSCINYRFVTNDACCRDWVPMPEAGRKLIELVAWLKLCSHTTDLLGKPWDYRRLSFGGAFDPHIVSYGDRHQFWLTVIPTEFEFIWNIDLNTKKQCVLCCGENIYPKKTYESKALCPEEGWVIVCRNCGRHTATINGDLSVTAQDAFDKWNSLFG